MADGNKFEGWTTEKWLSHVKSKTTVNLIVGILFGMAITVAFFAFAIYVK